MNNLFSLIQQFSANPLQILQKRFNIPQNLNDPNQIIQHLLDTKQVTQEQVDNVKQMQNNPLFASMFKNR